ncbi:hypothetical protein AN403_5945 [Pseudomonas fluorescens]|uniref:Uncharacterized protein n=1 Tax=Pseudomonas fluorescens TaxID=294 RepID=A0A0N8NY35_PSEFL|nr:hypothetical protein AN403_5945 [Pseudomonas fluorescens]
MPSLGEAPNVRGKALWLLSRFSKVTRRKGGTLSGRYLNNGYVHKKRRQTQSLRQQAHSDKVSICQTSDFQFATRTPPRLPLNSYAANSA